MSSNAPLLFTQVGQLQPQHHQQDQFQEILSRHVSRDSGTS